MDLKKIISDRIRVENSRISSNIERDIEIITSYFGLGSEIFPTFESIGTQYSVSRQRIEQIIRTKFRGKIRLDDISILRNVGAIIENKSFHFYSEIISDLIDCSYIDEIVSLKGLMNLLNEYGLCREYSVYNYSILTATKNDFLNNEDLLIIRNNEALLYRNYLKQIRTIPGKIGLAEIEDISKIHSIKSRDIENIWKILRLTKEVWTDDINKSSRWFLFKDRDNTLYNRVEKLCSINTTVNSDYFVESIHNSLEHQRSSKYKIAPTQLVRRYYEQSNYVKKDGKNYVFQNIIPTKLNPIENELITYFSNNKKEYYQYTEISNYLEKLGYPRPTIEKTCFSSNVIYIDKSLGRLKYKIYPIANLVVSNILSNPNDDRYFDFKIRLSRLYDMTDIPITEKKRREQGILREWLFADKEVAKCGICSNLYHISALVVAHKKKRSECSQSERLDPNIVMPMCVFGCDYLYERKIITIKDGIVIRKDCKLTDDEENKLNKIIGNKISPEWLNGSEYFNV